MISWWKELGIGWMKDKQWFWQWVGRQGFLMYRSETWELITAEKKNLVEQNINENVEMGGGNKEEREDRQWRNNYNKSKCDKYKCEQNRRETEMVRTYGEKDWRCGYENMEVGGGKTQKDTKSETEVGWQR